MQSFSSVLDLDFERFMIDREIWNFEIFRNNVLCSYSMKNNFENGKNSGIHKWPKELRTEEWKELVWWNSNMKFRIRLFFLSWNLINLKHSAKNTKNGRSHYLCRLNDALKFLETLTKKKKNHEIFQNKFESFSSVISFEIRYDRFSIHSLLPFGEIHYKFWSRIPVMNNIFLLWKYFLFLLNKWKIN